MSKENRLFLRYIGPSMAGMLIAGSFSIVDTIFLGQGTGKLGLAAVALTWPLVLFFGAAGELIGSGAAVIIAQARGNGDMKKAQSVFGQMLSLNLAVSIIIGGASLIFLKPILISFGATEELYPAAFGYAQIMVYGALICMLMEGFIAVIRNDGSPFFAMVLVMVGLLGNIFLDWLFIMVLKWGAPGAAYATVVSQALAVLTGAVYFLTPKTELKYQLESLKWHWNEVKEILFTGIPIFGNMLSIIAMLFMHNFQAMRYGAVDGLAAYTLVSALESLGSLLMSGLAMGIQPLCAYMYGARQYKRQERMGKRGYWWAFWLGIGLVFFSLALRNIMPGWVGLSGDVASLAAHGVVLSSTAFILLGVLRVAGFYYQATGRIGMSSILIYGDSFFALPLCLFILPIWFGMNGVWLAMPVSRVILFGILCYFWFWKQPERDWADDGKFGKGTITQMDGALDGNR